MNNPYRIGDIVTGTTSAKKCYPELSKQRIIEEIISPSTVRLIDSLSSWHTTWLESVNTQENKEVMNMKLTKEEIQELAEASSKECIDKHFPEKEDLGKHYRFSFKGIKLDVYRILELFQITNPAQQHAIKKLLRAGKSIKPLSQDIDEVILTLERWKEMIIENE